MLTLDNERKTIGRNSRAKTRPLQYSVLVLIAKVQRAAGIFYPWKEGWLEMLRAGCAADYPAQVFGGGWPAALVNSLKRDQAAFDKLKPAAWGPHLIGKDPETESPNRPSKGNLMGTLWDYIDFELLPEFPSHDDGADRSIIVEDCFKLLWQFINCCESWETITAPAYLGELHALQRSELKKEREEADR
ncbi:MAG TPA: hypothetical protein VD994_10535, partial [Prosthecobacter sp.]|nr:hypothetical protein [Prosthecobacter sp.]